MKKRITVFALVLLVATSAGGFYYWRFVINDEQKLAPQKEVVLVDPFKNFSVSKKTYPVIYDLKLASDILVVVNKKHALPADYAPELAQASGVVLRPEALSAYQKLVASAKGEGIGLFPISSYRSYSDQEKLFNDYVAKDGQTKAETYSARPGYSEHQTGLAVDIGLPSGACNLEICMAQTKEGLWLAENAHEFGFIIRYPSGKEAETGYQYEPWHIRYVGVEVAKNIYESGYTLDSYFGIQAGDYAPVPEVTTN